MGVVRIWKAITYNQARAAFGFLGESNIGQSAFPAVQAAPAFPSSFCVPLGGNDDMCCLIPCAIDQDPYFRLTRDVAHKLVPATHPLKGKPAFSGGRMTAKEQKEKGADLDVDVSYKWLTFF